MGSRDTFLTLTDVATLHALAARGLRAKSFSERFVRSLVAQVDRGDLLVSRRQLAILWQLAYRFRRRLRSSATPRKPAAAVQPLLF
jgi:hypothetical protein